MPEHFIREKIKDKPQNKKKPLQKGLETICCAALFGFVACLVFFAVKPYAEQWFEPEPEQIEIPKDTKQDEEEEPGPEDEEKAEEAETSKKDTVYITEKKSMTLSDYQTLQNQLYQIGKGVRRSMVTVTGVTDGTDIFNSPYESTGQAAGLIIGENGKEYLILTDYRVIKDVNAIRVTFGNNEIMRAKLKAFDGNTGLAMLSIKVEKVKELTRNYLKIATLGNSLNARQGQLVVAVGNLLGSNDAVLTGNLISVTGEVAMEDANYRVLATDIATNGKCAGVLVNTDSEIIGMLMQPETLQKENTLAAVSVSELKELIELLSNGKQISYVGIKGSTVTEAISEEYGLPKGVYIKEVAMDSPAMNAGMQNGDVITEIEGTEISSMEDYQTAIFQAEPGTTIRITVRRQDGKCYKKIVCKVETERLK